MIAQSATNSGSHAGDTGFVCDPPRACLSCLAGSSLAQELTQTQIRRLYDAVSIHRLAVGEVLIAEDQNDDRLYVISLGEFEVTRRDAGDLDILLARLGRGAITGELSFLDGLRATVTVRATTDGACAIGIKRDGLEWLLRTDPHLVYRVMRAILRSAHEIVGSMDKAYLDFLKYVQN
jgi:CRP-like cAMP-binding protein